jgi:hypothetical protein
MGDSIYEIDLSGVGATTPSEAIRTFEARAQAVTDYNACRSAMPVDYLGHELDFTTLAIAKLEKTRRIVGGTATVAPDPDPGRWTLSLRAALCPSNPLEQPPVSVRALAVQLQLLSFALAAPISLRQVLSFLKDSLVRDVNDALRRCRVRSQVGTTAWGRNGEYDVMLRGLITVMYRYREFLWPEVYSHVLLDLLVARGSPGTESVSFDYTFGPVTLTVTLPETENHVLMIETSRYLTNQLFADWVTGGDHTPANGMDEYILRKLQTFLQSDFQEYNARPYQHYTTMALQNLFDFARNDKVRCAAQMVLDYISAKFAVSSNRLRRSVPFRRLKEHKDRTGLMDNDSDPQTHRFLMLSGMTEQLKQVSPQMRAPFFGRDIMQLAAVSGYRVPRLLLDLVMTEEHKVYYQRFHHAAVEIYSSTPEFLISAGGIWIESVTGLDSLPGLPASTKNRDAGWALPTTVMPTQGGNDRAAYIRLGETWDEWRINTGVAPGFAFGYDVEVPTAYFVSEGLGVPSSCSSRQGPWLFIDASGRCSNARPYGFYAAVYSGTVPSSPSPSWPDPRALIGSVSSWPASLLGGVGAQNMDRDGNTVPFGFFEIVPSRELSFEDFKAQVLAQNAGRTYADGRPNDYQTIDGRQILFEPGVSDDKYVWGVLDGVGHPDNIRDWPLAAGDVLNSEGHLGVIHIDNPAFQALTDDDVRRLRMSPVYSLRDVGSRLGKDLSLGVGAQLPEGRTSLRRFCALITHRLTLDMSEWWNPRRVAPRFTLREFAWLSAMDPTNGFRAEMTAGATSLRNLLLG